MCSSSNSSNNFYSKEQCERRCVKDVCKLKFQPVKCKSSTKNIYYDSKSHSCKELDEGCLGNGNSFTTVKECQNQCMTKNPKCTLPKEQGSLCNHTTNASYFYYDAKSKQCKKYNGKCPATINKFSTHRQCLWMCQENVCMQERVPSFCNTSRFFYNLTTRKCEIFPNGNCSGKGFESKDECQMKCSLKDICTIPVTRGSCNGPEPMWHFESKTGRCEKFFYGGCERNENNFLSEAICEKACIRNPCQSLKHPATCEIQQQIYYYDSKSEMCLFSNTSCHSESNQFLSLELCEQTCIVTNPCLAPVSEKSCEPTQTRYYYDTGSGNCTRFEFNGCGGNANNYKSLEECNLACKNNQEKQNETFKFTGDAVKQRNASAEWLENKARQKSTLDQPANSSFNLMLEHDVLTRDDVYADAEAKQNGYRCILPLKVGSCDKTLRRFYFDVRSHTCRQFTYSGCQGNANNFLTRDQCIKSCVVICYHPVETTLCSGTATHYHYNPTTGMCEKTPYWVCTSSLNNFNELDTCENICVTNVCMQKKKPGPCRGSIRRFYYDTETGRCLPFFYGGCHKNGNNFLNAKDCQKQCIPSNRCMMPPDANICSVSYLAKRFYFDAISGKCQPTNKNPCDSNANSFKSLQKCESHCKALDLCLPPPKIETSCSNASKLTRFYYNKTKGVCEKHLTCLAEGFESLSSCEMKCPINICILPSEHGPCNFDSVRYYYSPESKICQPFIYGGCFGNKNNFKSLKECVSKCVQEPCNQSKKYGSCEKRNERYFYDSTTYSCLPFIDSGCRHSSNNFPTLSACQNFCATHNCQQLLKNTTCNVCELKPEAKDCEHLSQRLRFYFNSSVGRCLKYEMNKCGSSNGNSFNSLDECVKACDVGVCQLSPLHTYCGAKTDGQFYYDTKTDTCKPFKEGFCGGNLNRFSDVQQCERKCIRNICHLHKDTGPCKMDKKRVFYNHFSGHCEEFHYGGCKGNKNNFFTKQNCEKECMKDPCKLPKDTGLCRAFIHKYYYNSNTGQCEEFVYGGCGGNVNRFDTREACQQKCKPNPCYQPLDAGPCEAIVIRYLYDPKSGDCKKFHYGGCKGNENNFVTYEECQQTCIKDVCEQPIKVGPCKSMIERFYYNSTAGKCERFYYGGCDGNKNNFKTAKECQKRCVRDRCSLRPDAGPCHNKLERFYFDLETGSCRHFIYGGCFGNANRFVTVKQCEQFCIHNRCEKEMDPGVCDKNLTRFFYDSKKGRCISFSYGGCGGNSNNFKSMNLCNDACLRENTCLQQKYSGRCTAEFTRYYYDSDEGKCLEFVYGGCDGNGNNFETLSECQRTCATERMKHKNKCHLPRNRGHCYSPEERFYFNYTLESCEQFTYNGCGGNANNFLSESHCDRECKFDPCKQPIAVGSCHRREKRWYFDKRSQLCRAFYYSGCGGNNNNFESIENCEQMCVKPTCRQEMATGSCRQNMSRFYYNWNHGRCYQFTYTGCNGNENRFLSMNECMKKCTVDPCLQPLSFIGHCSEERKYFYNREFGICQAFIFNGCQSNGNIFSSAEECHKSCQHMYEIDLAR